MLHTSLSIKMLEAGLEPARGNTSLDPKDIGKKNFHVLALP